MAAQLYGALPIARTRGGFTDLSDELTPAASGGTGLWIPEPSRASLLATLDRALALFGNTEGWGRWQRRAMQSDFSWQATAEAYDRIYSSLQSEEFTA